jgi:hypothetical protein
VFCFRVPCAVVVLAFVLRRGKGFARARVCVLVGAGAWLEDARPAFEKDTRARADADRDAFFPSPRDHAATVAEQPKAHPSNKSFTSRR